jgi:hypothetical protein
LFKDRNIIKKVSVNQDKRQKYKDKSLEQDKRQKSKRSEDPERSVGLKDKSLEQDKRQKYKDKRSGSVFVLNPRERIGFAELSAKWRIGSPLLAANAASIKNLP